uniref:Chemokine (C motif) receptor 1a, duplicate 1 n=1 Tax=Sinocyclocheilus rhinocerous TaxID=307959 RepID=A0A673J942_9TELE
KENTTKNNMTDENTVDPNYLIEVYSDELCRKEVVKVGSSAIPLIFTAAVVLTCLTNVSILNLAVRDLLFIFGLPFWASYYIWGWTFGEVGCKAVKFFFYVGFYSSVLFLTLMTVQRYMRCRGLSVSPFIGWILSGTAALLGSLHSKVMTESESLYCEYDSVEWRSGIAYFQNAFFFIAFLIMGYCYGRMLRTITKSRTNKRHKTVRLIFCIALVFFIGWAPYNIVMFLKSLTFHPFTDCEVSISLEYAYYACRMIAFSHCCINPAILVFVDAKFCNTLREISRRFSLHHLLTSGSSAVNGCRQNESPNS